MPSWYNWSGAWPLTFGVQERSYAVHPTIHWTCIHQMPLHSDLKVSKTDANLSEANFEYPCGSELWCTSIIGDLRTLEIDLAGLEELPLFSTQVLLKINKVKRFPVQLPSSGTFRMI